MIAQHEPGKLHGWVFAQDSIWVDKDGIEHKIATMDLDYIDALIGFIHRHPQRFLLVWMDWLEETDVEAPPYSEIDVEEWLEGTPLMIALRGRAESCPIVD